MISPASTGVSSPKRSSFYERIGYTYVEVPYAVPEDIIRLTLPPEYDAPGSVEPFGCLVGSAEQSLLHLGPAARLLRRLQSLLPSGAGSERTLPASLHEGRAIPSGDEFMNPMQMLMDAQMFMSKFAALEVLRTDQGKDLTVAVSKWAPTAPRSQWAQVGVWHGARFAALRRGPAKQLRDRQNRRP
jgi:hypothetical protein